MGNESQSQIPVESQNQTQIDLEESNLSFQSQNESESSNGKIPPLYGVYLLNSLSKKSCYYIGSTPDPVRRLRQHNGELSRGGAFRTKKKGYRPWRMVLYVYGFPSKINALQFEHAWQHAYQTRHIPFERRINPGQKNTGSGTSIHSKIANCRLLLNSDSFRRLGLKIAIFNNSIYDVWLKNRYSVPTPEDMQVDVKIGTENLDAIAIIGGNYNQLKEFKESNLLLQENYFKKCIDIGSLDTNLRTCEVCKSNVKVDNGLSTLCICTFKDCKSMYHLECLANKFLNDENNKNKDNLDKDKSKDKDITVDQIVPKRGKCLRCNKVNFWNLIIRGTSHLQDYKNIV